MGGTAFTHSSPLTQPWWNNQSRMQMEIASRWLQTQTGNWPLASNARSRELEKVPRSCHRGKRGIMNCEDCAAVWDAGVCTTHSMKISLLPILKDIPHPLISDPEFYHINSLLLSKKESSKWTVTGANFTTTVIQNKQPSCSHIPSLSDWKKRWWCVCTVSYDTPAVRRLPWH